MAELCCNMCDYSTVAVSDLNKHIIRRHKFDKDFFMECPLELCSYSTKSYIAFRAHFSRHKRKREVPLQIGADVNQMANENVDLSESNFRSQVANFALRMICKHNLSEAAVDDIIQGTSDLIGLSNDIKDSGIAIDTVFCLEELKTDKLRCSRFKRSRNYIEPVRIEMGAAYERKRGNILTRTPHFGYISPLKETLENYLSMNDIYEQVESQCTRMDMDNILMEDYCDGTFVRNNAYLNAHNKCLQVVLYTDSLVIINPISAHRRQKLNVFYWTLTNVQNSWRSQWKNIHVYAICKTEYITLHGHEAILKDFIHTMMQLYDGMDLRIRDRDVKMHGMLLAVLADAPAIAEIGGFKSCGGNFARKPCFQCNITSTELHTKITVEEMSYRCPELHRDRCARLEAMRGGQRTFWSRIWGINKSSAFLQLPYNVSYLLDVFHILHEGLVPIAMANILKIGIERNYFSLAFLNAQLRGWNYSYLDRDDIAEVITRKQLFEDNQLRQTGAAIMHLCYILPFLIYDKYPDNDNYYKNFMQLISISQLSTSPAVDLNTAGELQILIEAYLSLYKHLHGPNLRPKQHLLLHFPNEIKTWGPLRAHWLFRYESMNNFLKQMHMKNFKNVSYSLMKRVSLHACYKYYQADYSKKDIFMAIGDQVKQGRVTDFSTEHRELYQQYQHVLGHDDCQVYATDEIILNGMKYATGAYLLKSWDDNWPLFYRIDKMYVHGKQKLSVCTRMDTQEYIWKVNAYVVTQSDFRDIILPERLVNKWPVPGYLVAGKILVVNRGSKIEMETKVWKVTAPNVRTGVLVTGDTITSIITKAAKKMGLDNEDLQLYLASDKFVIDEDILLTSDVVKGQTLMICNGEPPERDIPSGQSTPTSTVSTGDSEINDFTSTLAQLDSPSTSTANNELDLPKFSSGVVAALQDNRSVDVWGQVLDEMMCYYTRRYPNRLKSSSEYNIIGRKMYRQYPSLARFGTHPWSALMANLSSRIRAHRFKMKKKSSESEITNSANKDLLFTLKHQNNLQTDEEYDLLMDRLKSDMLRGKKDDAILLLMKETFCKRRDQLKQIDGRPMHTLMKLLPGFQEEYYVRKEFLLVRDIDEKRYNTYLANLNDIVSQHMADNVRHKQPEYQKLQCALDLERIVNFKKGRGGSSKSVFKILNDVNAREADKKLISSAEEHPKLVVFTIGNSKVEMIKIVGDECIIHMSGTDLVASLLLLVCTYYVFDFAYPRKYQQILGLVQHEVLGDAYTGTRTNGFTDVISGMYANRKRKDRPSASGSVHVSVDVSSDDETYTDVGRKSNTTRYTGKDKRRKDKKSRKKLSPEASPDNENTRPCRNGKSGSEESDGDYGCLPLKRVRKKKEIVNV